MAYTSLEVPVAAGTGSEMQQYYQTRNYSHQDAADYDLPVTSYLTNPLPFGSTLFTEYITGRVYDRNDANVANATVLLFRQSDNYHCDTTTTNAQGVYMFLRRNDDPNQYYTVAYTVAGGTTQVHGTSDRGLVAT